MNPEMGITHSGESNPRAALESVWAKSAESVFKSDIAEIIKHSDQKLWIEENEIKIEKKIGSGKFGVVRKGHYQFAEVALKLVDAKQYLKEVLWNVFG